MKAMIFAAGLGTRLRPITDNKPKALVEVGGVPMLRRVIENLKRYEIDEIVVNVHHFPDRIKEYLSVNDNFGVKLHISDESDKLLDTGGGILKAREWLDGDEPFLVHNADILTDVDLGEMIQHHRESDADATLLVAQRTTSRYLLMDNVMRMHGWTNVKTGEVKPAEVDMADYRAYAFGGVHIVSPSLFDDLERYGRKADAFSIMPFYIEACGAKKIAGYEPAIDYNWFDIGKPETLKSACEWVKDSL